MCFVLFFGGGGSGRFSKIISSIPTFNMVSQNLIKIAHFLFWLWIYSLTTSSFSLRIKNEGLCKLKPWLIWNKCFEKLYCGIFISIILIWEKVTCFTLNSTLQLHYFYYIIESVSLYKATFMGIVLFCFFAHDSLKHPLEYTINLKQIGQKTLHFKILDGMS